METLNGQKYDRGVHSKETIIYFSKKERLS